MQKERPYVLTIAGFDPSGGAGVLADVKTFEQLNTYGLSVITGMTLQTEDEFHSLQWRNLEDVEKEVGVLMDRYPVSVVKFGIIPHLNWLERLTALIRTKNKKIRIVVDPVRRSSTGFDFADYSSKKELKKILPLIDIITPNLDEISEMSGNKVFVPYLAEMSAHSAFLVKGGHDEDSPGTDYLYSDSQPVMMESTATNVHAKHGSGCVLSAAIASYLALGNDLTAACKKAKAYTERFLSSNSSLLGFHA